MAVGGDVAVTPSYTHLWEKGPLRELGDRPQNSSRAGPGMGRGPLLHLLVWNADRVAEVEVVSC